ncbi:hypothetical protein SEA_MUTANTE_59 [Mycobacterium phage Mutante]|uniref:DUF6378 domain-containing protein n=2 Tax=Pegunavirus Pg1 TaxID=1986538 RepID=A0A2Z5HEW9_9CAUD|nr:hypothetical protein SEA_LONGACAUDA_60 [Mycobacterium phage Longacauda]AXC37313.1 hypothetical protein SEA_CRAFF_62 [Mycobacterium phage Craff]AXC38032.1 hypothetical protein SEA_MUTANTE_59 [Mycobacterium phage Mutante]AZF95565.1 hypothetical protein SEA_SQUIGGLE_60 [Mycobacterium Phage Squiggle]
MTVKPCTCDGGGYCPMHGCPHKTGDRACRCADELHTIRGQQPTEVPVERPKPGTVGIGTPPHIAVKGAPERMAESEALRASLKGSPERPEIPPTGQLAEDIAREAIGLFNGPRQATYGDAADNFGVTASMWSAILGTEVTAEQVALCLATLKIARLRETPDHHDSWVDAVAYIALGAGVMIRHKAGGHD